MLDQGTRSVNIFADLPVTCAVLNYSCLKSETSGAADQLRSKLFANVARALAKKLRQATLEIKSLRNLECNSLIKISRVNAKFSILGPCCIY
jgi:hypothetical protein